jgi:hypothetical protein
MWTVEWLDGQKRRVLTETSSTCPIAVAQPFASHEQHKVRKRKRDVERSLATTTSITQDASHTANEQNMLVKPDVDIDIKAAVQQREYSPLERQPPSSDELKIEEVETNLIQAQPLNQFDSGSSTEPVGDGGYQFFLLKPRTSSSCRVLIPLTSTITLGECLNGRTVLEFPTIYVFPGSGQQLPENFMLEEDYLQQEGEEQKEFAELISELDPEILKRLNDDGEQSGARSGQEEVDSKEILDVLKKDFGAVI